jgi:hypothetical protein
MSPKAAEKHSGECAAKPCSFFGAKRAQRACDINSPRGAPAIPFQSGRESGAFHLDALAAERHSLGTEMRALAGALGEGAIGADHSPPGQVGVVTLEENRTGEAGCARGDIAVGSDEAGWDLADAGEDLNLEIVSSCFVSHSERKHELSRWNGLGRRRR